MARIKVRDMPRKQQKAVFASLNDPSRGYLNRLESAEQFHRRREYLIKRDVLSEDTEDRIARIMSRTDVSDKRKLELIEEEKAKAREKLQRLKELEGAPTVVGGIKAMRAAKIRKQTHPVQLINVPGGIERDAFNAHVSRTNLPSNSLVAHKGLLLTQKEYVQGLKNQRKLPSGASVSRQPSGIDRAAFNAVVERRGQTLKNTYIRVDGITLSAADYRKAMLRDRRVRYPAAHRAAMEKKALPVSRVTFEKGSGAFRKRNQIKRSIEKSGSAVEPYAAATATAKKLAQSKTKDTDKDGVVNAYDCKPFNRRKQDMESKAEKAAERALGRGAEAARKRFFPTQKEKLAQQRAKLREFKRKEQIRRNEAKIAKLKAEEKRIAAEKRRQQVQRVKGAASKVTGLFRRKKKSIYD